MCETMLPFCLFDCNAFLFDKIVSPLHSTFDRWLLALIKCCLGSRCCWLHVGGIISDDCLFLLRANFAVPSFLQTVSHICLAVWF